MDSQALQRVPVWYAIELLEYELEELKQAISWEKTLMNARIEAERRKWRLLDSNQRMSMAQEGDFGLFANLTFEQKKAIESQEKRVAVLERTLCEVKMKVAGGGAR